MASKTRLYVDHPLAKGQSVPLSRDQSNYLFAVMRHTAGDVLSLINSRDGEWDATVAAAHKKNGVLVCNAQTSAMVMPPDLWLIFAPIRKDRTAFLVEKAVELGVRRLIPVLTDYTSKADRIRIDKLRAQAVEAAEQCGATFVPEIDALTKLDAVLDRWTTRPLVFADESAAGTPVSLSSDAACKGGGALLIGPEGGFSARERARIADIPAAQSLSLGPRILRAETAALAALTLWQSQCGDWIATTPKDAQNG